MSTSNQWKPDRYTHGYFDMINPADMAGINAQLFSHNFTMLYPGYFFQQTFAVRAELEIKTTLHQSAWIFLQPGAENVYAEVVGFRDIRGFPEARRRKQPVSPGDMVFLPPETKVVFTEGAGYFWLVGVENRLSGGHMVGYQPTTYKQGIVRLLDCTNTKGGCNTGGAEFNPKRDFRRLLWSSGDKDNPSDPLPDFFNPPIEAHVPHILRATSRPHWHPWESPIFGGPQHEFYMVLDHRDYGLEVDEGQATLRTYPDGANAKKFDEWELEPGQIWSIPPGVGHWANNATVIVIAVPRFDLRNEIPVGMSLEEFVASQQIS